MGPLHFSLYLAKYEETQVPQGTIRHTVRRNRNLIILHLPSSKHNKFKREFVNWYSAKPFEIVQIYFKHIRGQKALTKGQIAHLDRHNIPNYQWSAMDVSSYFKMIAYSCEKS